MDLDIYDYALEWQKADVNPLVRFPGASSIDMPEMSRELLRDVGLPSSAAPFLNFGDRDAQLVPLAEAWNLDDGEHEGALVIGDTGDGDPICLLEGDGTIIAFDHETDFDQCFVNTSVVHLAYFLLKYRAFVMGGALVTSRAESALGALEDELRQIDAPALQAGGFWRTVLDWDRSPTG